MKKPQRPKSPVFGIPPEPHEVVKNHHLVETILLELAFQE